MAAFDPDAYLSGAAPPAAAAPAFDPDAYLRGARAPAAPPMAEIPGPRRAYAAMEVPGAALRNLPASAKQFATGIYEAVTNPLQTITAVLDVGAGALRKSLPNNVVSFIDKFDADPAATQRAVDMAQRMGGVLADRYGSYESIKRTFAEDPVGAAGDLSTLLTGGAAVTGAARMPAVAAGLERAATLTNPLTAVTAPAQAALGAYRDIRPSALQTQQQANLPRDLALQRAQAEGYMTTPGSVAPVSGRFVMAERIAGKTMLEQMMSARNQQTTDRLARRALDVGDDVPLTYDTTKAVRAEEFTKGYAPIKNLGNIVTDPDYVNNLAAIEQRYRGAAGSFPQAVPQTVTKLVDNHLVGNFDAADAVSRIRDLRNDAAASFRRNEPDVGFAQRGIANALEDQIERSIQASGAPNAADMLNQFRASRERMAISHTIEDAIKEGTGHVSAAKLASRLQAGKPLAEDLQLTAEFASRFPRVTQMPSQFGTPSSGSMLGVTNALGAGIGAMTGGVPGAVVGSQTGLMSQAIPSLMRRYLMSESAQRAATPRYDPLAERLISDVGARNALLLQQADELRRERNALMGLQ